VHKIVPIARNPFTAALISSYAQSHDNNLPQNHAELYTFLNEAFRARVSCIEDFRADLANFILKILQEKYIYIT
jgi:recombinational DNA repair protein (RecF pathway)